MGREEAGARRPVAKAPLRRNEADAARIEREVLELHEVEARWVEGECAEVRLGRWRDLETKLDGGALAEQTADQEVIGSAGLRAEGRGAAEHATTQFRQSGHRIPAVGRDHGVDRSVDDPGSKRLGLRRGEAVPDSLAHWGIEDRAGGRLLPCLRTRQEEVDDPTKWQVGNLGGVGKVVIRGRNPCEPGWTAISDPDIERQLGRVRPIRVHDEDLFVAVAIARERELRTVGRPFADAIPDTVVLGERGDTAPVRVHDEDIAVAPIAVAVERNPGAVGGPLCASVIPGVIGKPSHAATDQI